MSHPFIEDAAWERLQQGIINLAKQEVLSRFEKVGFETKADGSLLTEADTQMQLKTQEFLEKNWPEFAFLGEETPAVEQNAAMRSQQGCWILDPVDGTSNFASGIPFFAVSLGLMIDSKVVAGLIYDPARDELFSARKGQGAELNGQPLNAHTAKTEISQCSGIIDFKRLNSTLATNIAQKAPYSSQRSFGSVALDWCWIAAGRGQIYLHGAQHIWDYAAGWIILDEAGGFSATLEEESVLYPEVVKRSAVAATTAELFAEWQAYIRNHS